MGPRRCIGSSRSSLAVRSPPTAARDLVHPDDLPVIDALVPCAQQGKDFDVEFRLITSGGALKHVHVVGNRLDEAKERPGVRGARSRTSPIASSPKKAWPARAANSPMWRGATALSALTASIAHEVNQPLAGVITNANTCLRMLALDPPNIEGAQATASA